MKEENNSSTDSDHDSGSEKMDMNTEVSHNPTKTQSRCIDDECSSLSVNATEPKQVIQEIVVLVAEHPLTNHLLLWQPQLGAKKHKIKSFRLLSHMYTSAIGKFFMALKPQMMRNVSQYLKTYVPHFEIEIERSLKQVIMEEQQAIPQYIMDIYWVMIELLDNDAFIKLTNLLCSLPSSALLRVKGTVGFTDAGKMVMYCIKNLGPYMPLADPEGIANVVNLLGRDCCMEHYCEFEQAVEELFDRMPMYLLCVRKEWLLRYQGGGGGGVVRRLMAHSWAARQWMETAGQWQNEQLALWYLQYAGNFYIFILCENPPTQGLHQVVLYIIM